MCTANLCFNHLYVCVMTSVEGSMLDISWVWDRERVAWKFKVDELNEWMNLLKLFPSFGKIFERSLYPPLFCTLALENREAENSRWTTWNVRSLRVLFWIILYHIESDQWWNRLPCSLSTTSTTKAPPSVFGRCHVQRHSARRWETPDFHF